MDYFDIATLYLDKFQLFTNTQKSLSRLRKYEYKGNLSGYTAPGAVDKEESWFLCLRKQLQDILIPPVKITIQCNPQEQVLDAT